MSIEPIDALDPVEPAYPTCPPEPVAPAPAQRDLRAEALNIAQHGTAFIPGPLPFLQRGPGRRRGSDW